jgi:4-aminobutyrate aminotransferase-like enzyme
MRDVVEIQETGAFDAILASRPPGFSEEDAIAIAARTFALAPATARNLGSERDQTFLLTGGLGEGLAIMKISNAAENPATLDMEALGVLPRVRAAGAALRAGIRDVAQGHRAIGDVRGIGLAIGIEIVRDRETKEPDPETTTAIKEGMRDRGVLVGTTGAAGNILKVRPPLAFTTADVPAFIEALEGSLSGRGASPSRQP